MMPHNKNIILNQLIYFHRVFQTFPACRVIPIFQSILENTLAMEAHIFYENIQPHEFDEIFGLPDRNAATFDAYGDQSDDEPAVDLDGKIHEEVARMEEELKEQEKEMEEKEEEEEDGEGYLEKEERGIEEDGQEKGNQKVHMDEKEEGKEENKDRMNLPSEVLVVAADGDRKDAEPLTEDFVWEESAQAMESGDIGEEKADEVEGRMEEGLKPEMEKIETEEYDGQDLEKEEKGDEIEMDQANEEEFDDGEGENEDQVLQEENIDEVEGRMEEAEKMGTEEAEKMGTEEYDGQSLEEEEEIELNQASGEKPDDGEEKNEDQVLGEEKEVSENDAKDEDLPERQEELNPEKENKIEEVWLQKIEETVKEGHKSEKRERHIKMREQLEESFNTEAQVLREAIALLKEGFMHGGKYVCPGYQDWSKGGCHSTDAK